MQRSAATDSTRAVRTFGIARALIRRIVDSVAEGQKYHLKVVFSDNSIYHSTRLGDPDVTIIFRNRPAEWRAALGGVFEFLEAYFNGDVDIVGEQGLRRLIISGIESRSDASSTG